MFSALGCVWIEIESIMDTRKQFIWWTSFFSLALVFTCAQDLEGGRHVAFIEINATSSVSKNRSRCGIHLHWWILKYHSIEPGQDKGQSTHVLYNNNGFLSVVYWTNSDIPRTSRRTALSMHPIAFIFEGILALHMPSLVSEIVRKGWRALSRSPNKINHLIQLKTAHFYRFKINLYLWRVFSVHYL